MGSVAESVSQILESLDAGDCQFYLVISHLEIEEYRSPVVFFWVFYTTNAARTEKLSWPAVCFDDVKSVPRLGCNGIVLEPTKVIAETIVGPTTSNNTHYN